MIPEKKKEKKGGNGIYIENSSAQEVVRASFFLTCERQNTNLNLFI